MNPYVCKHVSFFLTLARQRIKAEPPLSKAIRLILFVQKHGFLPPPLESLGSLFLTQELISVLETTSIKEPSRLNVNGKLRES